MKKSFLVLMCVSVLCIYSSVSLGDDGPSCGAGATATSDYEKIKELSENLEGSTPGVRGPESFNSIDRSKPEYSGIGMIKANMGAMSTAYLANQCLVWAPKSAFFKNDKAVGKKVIFNVGFNSQNQASFSNNILGQVIAAGDSQSDSDDWILIKLQHSVSSDVNPIPTLSNNEDNRENCVQREIVGFPTGKSLRRFWKMPETCLEPYRVHGACPITAAPGSPVLCKGRDGQVYATGLMSQQIRKNPRGLFPPELVKSMQQARDAFDKYKDTCE